METIFAAAVLALAVLAPVETQKPTNVPRVGFLHPGLPSTPLLGLFRKQLAEIGYVDGQNVIIEPRFAEGQYDRIPQLAADLVRRKVDLIAVQGAVTARPLKKAVQDVPIVFAVVVDPVAEDLVKRLDRRDENITGVTTFDPQQPRKVFELLKKTIPGVNRVGLLGDRDVRGFIGAMEDAAHSLGLATQQFRVTAPAPNLEGAFAAFKEWHADAVVVMEEPVVMTHRQRIAALAARDRLPSMFSPLGADAGGLLAYGTSFTEGYRHWAAYVGKVLEGARPGDLPVDVVNSYELAVNLKTAREIGVTIPADILERADRVIR
jgi:putative ABC transport system substrate-binding protein